MNATLTDFETGWYGLSLELSSREIDALVYALTKIRDHNSHIHFRSAFEGAGGVGDIEISCTGETEHDGLSLDASPVVSPADSTAAPRNPANGL